jgi:ABC-type multidrug transport system fused ATPase/permease subunit
MGNPRFLEALSLRANIDRTVMPPNTAPPDHGDSAMADKPAAPSVCKVLLCHRSAWLSLGLVVLHQSLIAGGTYFLTRVITQFQAGSQYAGSLYLFLACMTLPYLPGCCSLYAMQRWINQAHARLVTTCCDRLCGRTDLFRNAALKERIGSALASNALPVLRDYVTFVHELATSGLNSLLSMLVIGLLLPSKLLLGFALSLVLCAAFVVATRHAIARASASYERSYIRYASTLGHAWDNLTLGNRHNETIWRARRAEAGHDFYRSAARMQAVKQAGNAALGVLALLPSVYLIISVTRDGHASAGVIAAIIVSLTRIFLVLNSLGAMVARALDFSSVHSRLRVLLETTDVIHAERRSPTGLSGDVNINGTAITAIEEARHIIGGAQRGRFTITGANGSGKSTILLALKHWFQDRSFLLPAHHSQLVWQSDLSSLSSGERTKASMSELLQLQDIHIVLLDEWDANLDASNREAIGRLLDRSCLDRIIVEVRH